MFEEKIRLIIEDKYAELVNLTIEKLKALPIHHLPHQVNRSFPNIWEAFAHQLQHEDNALYYTYLNVVETICYQQAQQLTKTELKLLWLISDGCLEWDDAADFPAIEAMLEAVAEELLSWVEQEAEEPQLEHHCQHFDDAVIHITN